MARDRYIIRPDPKPKADPRVPTRETRVAALARQVLGDVNQRLHAKPTRPKPKKR